MFKKIVQGTLLTLFLLIIGVYFYALSGPKLPEKTDAIINEVLTENLPQLVTGQTGYATSSGVKIWYESKMPSSLEFQQNPKGVVLLMMGQGMSAVSCPLYLYEALLKEGYQVIRTDHRGLGLSDWIQSWDQENAYTISDMATDNIAVLDELNINKVHIIGISMGGIIGQQTAINHPERVNSLTSIMSSGYAFDPDLPAPPIQIQNNMVKLLLRFGLISSEKNTMKMMIGLYDLLKGDKDTEVDIKEVSRSALYELRKRNGFNYKASYQHAAAVKKSGSLYQGLSNLAIPTFVIHGESDPLLDIIHAKKYAELIPNSDTLWIEGMGHELSQRYALIWVSKTLEFIDKFHQNTKTASTPKIPIDITIANTTE